MTANKNDKLVLLKLLLEQIRAVDIIVGNYMNWLLLLQAAD